MENQAVQNFETENRSKRRSYSGSKSTKYRIFKSHKRFMEKELKNYVPRLNILFFMWVMISLCSCTPFIGTGIFLPTNNDMIITFGTPYYSFELGGARELKPPVFLRGGFGYSIKHFHKSNTTEDYSSESGYLTFRTTVLCMLGNIEKSNYDGLYIGTGLTVFTWGGDIFRVGGASQIYDSNLSAGAGPLLTVGYSYKNYNDKIGFFGELIYEHLEMEGGRDRVDPQYQKELGGFSIMVGIQF